jgi:pteridine reductase
MTEKYLIGKNALVTGAAKRIGRTIALELASRGANIAVHYRDSAEEAREMCRELKKQGVECWRFKADFEKKDEYEKLIDTVLNEAGRLDILVNSASIFPESALGDITWEGLLSTVHVNSWAPFCISRSFAERVKAGTIVNLLDARTGGFDLKHVAYMLSKQILESFTRMMALEFAPHIRINGVAPGLILPPPGKDEHYLEKIIPTIPLKRRGSERHVADAVLFLILNDFITGQVIYVDGGRHLLR